MRVVLNFQYYKKKKIKQYSNIYMLNKDRLIKLGKTRKNTGKRRNKTQKNKKRKYIHKKNAIFVFPGNCRTFIDCFDSCYKNVISKLFSEDTYNIYVYFYLKLIDPGPKGQRGWDYSYKNVDYDTLLNKINDIKSTYAHLNIEYKIIEKNEISDEELLSQVKDKSRYIGPFISIKTLLVRGLHIAYNFECCGKYILEKEKKIGATFNNIVYIRPDLYFVSKIPDISKFNNTLVTTRWDWMAIIPRKYLKGFFFERINVYRNNTTKFYRDPEDVYWDTIKYESMDKYFSGVKIKRS